MTDVSLTSIVGGQWSTKTIKNAHSVAGFSPTSISSLSGAGVIAVSSGAQTANTLTTMFSYSGGRIIMPHLTIRTADTTARTIRVRVTIDGDTSTYAFDYTSASTSATDRGLCLAGVYNSTNTLRLPEIRAESSLLVEWATSNNETNKLLAEYFYQEMR